MSYRQSSFPASRRSFIALLGGAAAALPRAARAQQPAIPVVGYLSTGRAESNLNGLTAFRNGLSQMGYVEGRNVRIEYRWADNQYDRLPALVADLIRRNVAVIVAGGSVNAALTAKQATQTIPIVFMLGSDPVQIGLVDSLNRPGANVTGVTSIARELLAKRLELMRELLPRATAVGFLDNPDNPNTVSSVQELETLARAGGWRLRVIPVRNEAELGAAFATFKESKTEAFLTGTDAFLTSGGVLIATLAISHAIPGIHQYREFVEAGGLISYGPSRPETSRQGGVYAGRILKGEKPADLPVMQPTKFETVLNLRTARALGLTVPTETLLRADEVIE
jgi:putative tryptophan/tyrosine transport system substrate-binding protein